MAADTLPESWVRLAVSVLPFPPRNKGRIRRSRSQEAMGRCSLSLLERGGESIPPNVVDIRAAREVPQIDDGSLAFKLVLAVFATLSGDQKDDIRNAVRVFARHDDGPAGDQCRVLYRLIEGDKAPC